MITVQISKEDHDRLEELGKNYFVVKGHKPMPVNDVVHMVIFSEWRRYKPWKPEPLREDQGR